MPFVHSVVHKPGSFVPYIMTRRELGEKVARDAILVLNGPNGHEVGILPAGGEWSFSEHTSFDTAVQWADYLAQCEAMR